MALSSVLTSAQLAAPFDWVGAPDVVRRLTEVVGGHNQGSNLQQSRRLGVPTAFRSGSSMPLTRREQSVNWKNLSVLPVVWFAACGGPDRDRVEVEHSGEVGAASHAEALSNYAPGNRANAVSIPMCFNSNVGPEFRGRIRKNIEGTWGLETGIVFVGWDTCDQSAGVVSIKNEPLSHNGWGLINSIGLVLTSSNLDSASVHEVGHILGFQHEQARSDSTCNLQQPGESIGFNESVGGGGVTPFDPLSIMNYCRIGNSIFLSDWDIGGSGLIYGPPVPLAVTSWGPGRIDAFGLQAGNSAPQSRRMWHYWSNNNGANWDKEYFDIAYPTSGIAAVSRQAGNLDIFVRDYTGRITWRNYSNGWSGWTQLASGFPIEGTPAAVAIDANTVVVAARSAHTGTTSSSRTMIVRITSGVPSAPVFGPSLPLATEPTGQLSVATSTDVSGSFVHVAYRTRNEDLRVDKFSMNGLAFSNSTPLLVAAPVGSSPSLVYSNGKLEVVYRESGTTSTIHHGTGTGSTWTFQTVGGVALGNPALVSWAPGRLDLVVRGTSNGIFHAYRSPGGSWSGYASLGGTVLGSPSLVVPPTAPNSEPVGLSVFVVGTGNGAFANRWTGTGWSGFQFLGGSIR